MKDQYKTIKAIIICALIITLLSSCDMRKIFGRSDEQNFTGEIVLSTTTKIVSPNDAAEIISISPDQTTIVASEANESLSNLKKGDIIATGISSQTPNGLLRKVDEISTGNGQSVFTTSQATLEDAIQDGSITINQEVSANDMLSSRSVISGVTFSTSLSRPNNKQMANAQPSLSFQVNLNNVLIFDADNDPNTTNDQITASGSLQLGFQMILSASFQSHTLSSALFKIISSESLSLVLNAGYSGSIEVQKEICTVALKPILFTISGLPIVIVPVIRVIVGTQGTASIGMSVGVQQDLIISEGLSYSSQTGQWTPISTQESTFDYSQPSVSAECSIKGYLNPSITLGINSPIGPIFSLSPYLELDASLGANNVLDLYCGITGKVGIDFSVISKVFHQEYDMGLCLEVLDYRKKIYTCPWPTGIVELDQSQEKVDYGFWFERTVERWQEFNPSMPNLSSIDTYLYLGGAQGDLIASIMDCNGNTIASSIIDEGNLDFPMEGWMKFVFPWTLRLDIENNYRIGIRCSLSSTNQNYYFWMGTTKSNYSAECLCDVNASGNYWPNYDYAFRTYGYR